MIVELDHVFPPRASRTGLGHEERRERARSRCGAAAPARGRPPPVLTLLDRRAERVQLGELRTLVVRQQQPHVLVAVGEAPGDALAELVEPLPGRGGYLQRAGEPVPEPAPAERIDQVDLVQDELDGNVVGADLVQHRLDGVDHLVQPLVGGGGVDDVQDEVSDERLLERRGEPLDELGRQAPDEADGVGDEVALAVVLEPARRRIERLEEAVLDRDLRARERIQKGRLADVRVARERHDRRPAPRTRLAAQAALLAELAQAAAQER